MHALIRIAGGCVLAAALVLLPGVAHAGEYPNCDSDEVASPYAEGGGVCIPAVDPGTPGDETPSTSTAGALGSQRTCTYDGRKIPCVTAEGVWFSSKQCYAQVAQPQPAKDDPVWAGKDPEKGDIWTCGRVFIGGPTDGIWFFYVPDGAAPALVDPGELAQETLEAMQFPVPRVHTAPTPPNRTYVHLVTWFWTQQNAFNPLTASATAGGTAVTVTAKPVRVWWDLGDGDEMTCTSPGRPWTTDLGDAATTDCGHSYSTISLAEPNGAFTVHAVLWYAADWTCSGACSSPSGSLGEVPSLAGRRRIEVGERQSVVIGGDS